MKSQLLNTHIEDSAVPYFLVPTFNMANKNRRFVFQPVIHLYLPYLFVEKTNVINMSVINVGFIYTKLAHTSKIHSMIVDELLDINNINIEQVGNTAKYCRN